MWQYNNTDELYHYGILGMKWGHRKSNYVTIRQGVKKARKAGKEAAKESFKNDKKNLHGIGSGRKALKNASKARKEAFRSSIKDSKSTNKQQREAAKIAKKSYKTELRNKSRYGQTTGEIAAKSVLKTLGTRAVTSAAALYAIHNGRLATAYNISRLGNLVIAGNAVDTTYKLLTNYKPQKTK